jgi:dihydrofolate synthase/folylpolyglutamate synthase
MTYDEAVAYLDSFTNYERAHEPQAMRQVKLERMRRLCRRLGDPQRAFRSVVVTGTNGKGSICAMLYSMLRESALRVGFYSSPHLEHVRERIRAWTPPRSEQQGRGEGGVPDGERAHGDDWISEGEWAAVVARLQPALEQMRCGSPEEAPTYFEALTAAAFLHFRARQIEVAVLEVGMGGRLDATNVVEQAVSVIGPIDLDHAEVLGPDAAAIAREKAGVIKPGQTVLSAAQPDDVDMILRAACDEQGVPLLACGRDLTAAVQEHALDGLQATLAGLRGIYESVAIPLLGRHQAQNAALAVGALEALSDTGVPHALVERGLARVDWPGRTELVHEAPLVLLDGAHNRHAAGALSAALAELLPGRRIHLLMGMSSDKSPEAVGASVGPLAASVTCTKSRHPRAMPPEELARRLAPYCQELHVTADADDAYTYLLNTVPPEDAIVVTGSLFLVGQLRGALRQSHIRPRGAPPRLRLAKPSVRGSPTGVPKP